MRSAFVFILLMSVTLSAQAKQETVRIEIRGNSLQSPITITDTSVTRQFSVWNGPGTRSYDGNGRLNPPAHLNPTETEGRFIDWPKGIVAEQIEFSTSFEVTFYIGEVPNQRTYPFTYARTAAGDRGVVYLPPASTQVIVHGIEGNWFYASKNWEEFIASQVIEGH